MDLLSYFRVLRRRWLVIVALVVVGGALGAASTQLQGSSGKERTYYKATSTLQLDTSSNDSGNQAYTNVDQVAILVTTGDVPDAVAKQLGTSESGRQLSEQVITLTSQIPNTIAITATDPDPTRAAALGNAFADQLVKNLDARLLSRYNQQRDVLNQQLASLKSQADDFLAQVRAVPPPPDVDTIQKQYDATQNQYYTVYGQLQQLATAGPPTSRLSKLERADAIPISKAEYESRLSLGASGQNNLRADAASGDGSGAISVSSSSTTLDDPVSRGLFGAFLGLLAGVALALVLDRLDHRIRTRTDAEAAFRLPVLAEVPKFTRSQQKDGNIVSVTAPLSRVAEAFRAIRTSVLFQTATVDQGPPERAALTGKGNGNGNANGHDVMDGAASVDPVFEPEPRTECLVVMVTSASPREGKTNTSANLAAVFAESGASVLVVNCDFRRPTVHRLFGVEDLPRTVQATSVPGVKIVTNVLHDPNANPSQVVAAQRQVIAAARDRFDVVVLDTAPVLTANDAIEVVGSADLVLLVARSEISTTDKAERAFDVLTRLDAPLGGVVLIASGEPSSEYYYYYQTGRKPSRRRADRPTTADRAAPHTVTVPGPLDHETS
jgi:Mrp family chromosome partitioning ATPase/capsular polysaccharide biosynthesis protein